MNILFIPIFFDALIVSIIGVLVVFSILALLAIILGLFPRLIYGKPEIAKEKPKLTTIREKIEIKIKEEGLKPDEIALITTAVTAFLEYKTNTLMKNPLLKQLPILAKLFPLAGVVFKAKLKLSLGGSEREVEVREESPGTYIVRVGTKTYTAMIKPPEEKIEIDLTKQ